MPAVTSPRFTPAERESLILDHLPQVRLIARRIHSGINPRIELEDLVSEGILGLIAAIDRFDPSREIKLKTYAEHRIRGAIMDSLRETDNTTRDTRHQAKLIAEAADRVEQRIQTTATREEVAAELGIPLEECNAVLRAAANAVAVSLDAPFSSDATDDAFTALSFVQTRDESPEDAAAGSQSRDRVAYALAHLCPQEASIISLFYGCELTMRQIAPLLNLTEWQVQERRRNAIENLRLAVGTPRTAELSPA